MVDHVTTGRLDGDSLWLYRKSGVDAACIERLHSKLSLTASLENPEPATPPSVVADIAATTPMELTYQHERGFRFEVEAGVHDSWIRTAPLSTGHLSWLTFVHLWATCFDALEFWFGTVQSGVPAAAIDSRLYCDPSQLLLYGPTLSDRMGREHLCATPALATGELLSGSVVVLVDRQPTKPVRRHLSGETVTDVKMPVTFPQTPPSTDRSDDVIEMLAYLGDWVPHRVGKFELQGLPTDSAVSRLASLLRDDRPRVRSEAAWGLGVVVAHEAKPEDTGSGPFHDHKVIEARSDVAAQLCERLRTDEDPAVRRAAAAALEEFPIDRSLTALATAVSDDPDPSVRTAATESFGLGMQLKPRARIDRLVDVLGPAFDSDPAPTVRKAAINSLVPAGGQRGFEYGVRALDDPDEEVRSMAKTMLLARFRRASGESATRMASVIESHATSLAGVLREHEAVLKDLSETHENAALREAVRTVYEIVRTRSSE